jgi:hypothetical protein
MGSCGHSGISAYAGNALPVYLPVERVEIENFGRLVSVGCKAENWLSLQIRVEEHFYPSWRNDANPDP